MVNLTKMASKWQKLLRLQDWEVNIAAWNRRVTQNIGEEECWGQPEEQEGRCTFDE